jgi:hypothetical protein
MRRLSSRVVIAAAFCLCATAAAAAEHPALAKARALYNSSDYDGAITSASMSRSDPASADASALVMGRSHLERHRLRGDAADLVAARELLGAVRVAALMPRDQLDLLIGLGQTLYLGEVFGAAAELFDTALGRASMLGDRDRLLLLDWWATSMDREAQRRPADRRGPIFERVIARMDEELRTDPGSAPANYWLAVSARGAGDLDRAWNASVAGWIRAALKPESAQLLRGDLDRLVTQVLMPERARLRPAREQADALSALRAEWDSIKTQWK